MNEELTKYLDEKFDRADKRPENIEVKVASLEVNIKEIKPEVRETKEIISKLFNRIDKFLAILERLDQEFTIMKKDMKRVKQAIKDKLGVDLF